MNQLGREVRDIDRVSLGCVLCIVDNHRVNFVDHLLQCLVAHFTLTQAERTTLGRAAWTTFVANRSVTGLSFRALRVAKVARLLGAVGAFPEGTVA